MIEASVQLWTPLSLSAGSINDLSLHFSLWCRPSASYWCWVKTQGCILQLIRQQILHTCQTEDFVRKAKSWPGVILIFIMWRHVTVNNRTCFTSHCFGLFSLVAAEWQRQGHNAVLSFFIILTPILRRMCNKQSNENKTFAWSTCLKSVWTTRPTMTFTRKKVRPPRIALVNFPTPSQCSAGKITEVECYNPERLETRLC